jgi:hypothetical protein
MGEKVQQLQDNLIPGNEAIDRQMQIVEKFGSFQKMETIIIIAQLRRRALTECVSEEDEENQVTKTIYDAVLAKITAHLGRLKERRRKEIGHEIPEKKASDDS